MTHLAVSHCSYFRLRKWVTTIPMTVIVIIEGTKRIVKISYVSMANSFAIGDMIVPKLATI